MKEHVLVLIKPDGITKGLTGHILTRLSEARLEIIAARVVRVPRKLAEEHYQDIKNQPFFEEVIQYTLGAFHDLKYVMALVLSGESAVKKCREIVGATNPEEAKPTSIRGSCGRITTRGVFENVLHASSDMKEAEREIKLWFQPDEIILDLFPTKKKQINSLIKRVWT